MLKSYQGSIVGLRWLASPRDDVSQTLQYGLRPINGGAVDWFDVPTEIVAAAPTPTASIAPKAESEAEWAHLKKFGYAPGGYMNKCHACGKVVEFVDKRATTCRPCAEAMHDAAPVAQAAAGASDDVLAKLRWVDHVLGEVRQQVAAIESLSYGRACDKLKEVIAALSPRPEADADRASGGGV